jgi:perosamine synthetase
MGKLAIEGGKPVRDNMLPYGRQSIDEDDIQVVTDVLRGDYLTQGPAIEKFEDGVARLVGAKYAVAFCNGTAALHAACYAAGIGPGDEVITSPMTFVASSNCVLYQGGTPVFADIRPDTYNLDVDQLDKLVTSRTKAIIPVDYTGQPAEMDRIMHFARDHKLIVIEDAAHSIGASYDGQPVGSLADMTMFSFHPVKHITTGEGGIIVTNNELYLDRLRLFRSHGITKDPQAMRSNEGPWYYEMHLLGFNYRMTDIQATLGSSQLAKLPSFVERRREIAKCYTEAFGDTPGLIVPWQHPLSNSSWHLYILRWSSEVFEVDRKQIFDALRAENIGVHVHYIPVYYQPYYRDLGFQKGLCPQAEMLYDELITLPIFPAMTDSDIQDVIQAVQKIYKRYVKPTT